MAREDGQAAVEMAALLPLVAAVLLVAWQFVLAGDARSSAAVAARAAARAAAVGADPGAAARERLPVRLRRGLRVRSGSGGAVTVSVRVPALAAPIDLGRVRARASLEAAE
jgi:pilus assembly protein CpaE